MSYLLRAVFGVALTIGLVACSAEKQPITGLPSQVHEGATGFLNHTAVVGDQVFPYVLYVPRDYTPDTPWPLIVFLHGAGERGQDGLLQTEVGIGTAIREHQDRFPALVLFPQCPEDQFWDAVIPALDSVVGHIEESYSVDPTRRYLTGVSMGGYATWIWGAERADFFAALLPICGGGRLTDIQMRIPVALPELFRPFDERIKRLATVPIYAYHGELDEVVPESRARETVDLVRAAGGTVKYKTYDDLGHECWDEVYGSKRAIEWLLQQRKTPS